MRVHTIEKIFSLGEIFSLVKSIINPRFTIDENSYRDDLNLLIIGINIKNQSVIIRGFIDKSKNRLNFSILALCSNQILKDINSPMNTIEITKSLGNTLYKFVKSSKENLKENPFTNLKIKRSKEKKLQIQLIETEKEILMKILGSLHERYNYSDALSKFPFSLSDIDGSWELWNDVYDQYIEQIENKFINMNNNSIKTFRNYDFAIENTYSQRIADLIITEEEKISNPTLTNSGRTIKNLHDNLKDPYLEEVEKGTHNLKITFVFAHKKKEQLKLIQMLKLIGEVKIFTQLMQKKEFRRYNHIYPQIIFISLFGFEERVGNYLKDNLYGNLSERLLILTLPPIANKVWHNYFVFNSMEENEYIKSQSLTNLAKYNKIRSNSGVNQIEVRKMESQYNDIVETKKVSEQNSQQLIDWVDILSVNNCSDLLDVKISREKILKATN